MNASTSWQTSKLTPRDVCKNVFFAIVIMTVIFIIGLVFYGVGSYIWYIPNNAAAQQVQKEIEYRQLIETRLKSTCPGLGMNSPCEESCMTLWRFYANVGTPEGQKLVTDCEGHSPRDKDGGAAFQTCLEQVAYRMQSNTYNITELIVSFNAPELCICHDEKVYPLANLLVECPYDQHQYRIAISTGHNFDAICMRPGSITSSVVIRRPDYTTDGTWPSETTCTDDNCSPSSPQLPASDTDNEPCQCPNICLHDYRNYMCCEPSGGECVNILTNNEHCGTCGNACNPDTERCENGECIEVTWDTCNCGKPGLKCTATQMCYDTQCINPLNKYAAEYARSHFQCKDGEHTHAVAVATSSGTPHVAFTTMEIITPNLKRQTVFNVLENEKDTWKVEPPVIEEPHKRDLIEAPVMHTNLQEAKKTPKPTWWG